MKKPSSSYLITIAGMPLSGKGTTGKLLASELGYEYYSFGTEVRAEADRRGQSLDQFLNWMQANPSFESELDRRQSQRAADTKLIVDSRLGFYFLPKSERFFLNVSIPVAAERLLGANRKEELARDAVTAQESISNRVVHDRNRYQSLYGIKDNLNTAQFKHVIDTSSLTPNQVVGSMIAKLHRK